MRNGLGATTERAWSARSRLGLGISVPFARGELACLGGDDHWSINTAQQHLAAGQGQSPVSQKLAIDATKVAWSIEAVLSNAGAGKVAHPTERMAAKLAKRNPVALVNFCDRRITVTTQKASANDTL